MYVCVYVCMCVCMYVMYVMYVPTYVRNVCMYVGIRRVDYCRTSSQTGDLSQS
jgi:hypothetical protein